MSDYHTYTDNGTRVQIIDSPADGNNFITQTAIVTSPNGVQSYCPAVNKTREMKVRFAIGYADGMTAILTLANSNVIAARFILLGDFREMYKSITNGSEFAKMKGGIPGFYGECLRLFSQHKTDMVKALEVDADFSFDETFESEAYISVSFPEYQNETALVVPGMDTIGVSFLTLYGDHSKNYASIMDGKECPYGDCLKYFREHLHEGGKFEFGSVYSILSVKNYSFDEWF
jgi:hypothetical protein